MATPSHEGHDAVSVKSVYSTIIFVVTIALVFLLPLISVSFVPVAFAKGVFLWGGIGAMLIVWVIEKVRGGTITFLGGALPAGVLSVIAVSLFSAIFSGRFNDAFGGAGIEIGTTLSVLLGGALFFIAARAFSSRSRIFALYAAFFSSFTLIALWFVIRLWLGPNVLSFGSAYATLLANPIGSWNELGIFFGIGAVIASTVLGLSHLRHPQAPLHMPLTVEDAWKKAAWTLWGISLFGTFIVGFRDVFFIVALIATILFFYGRAKGVIAKTPREAMKSPLVVTVFVYSVLFFAGATMLAHMPSALSRLSVGLTNDEYAVPTWSETVHVAEQAIGSHLLLGAGPHTYAASWVAFRPQEIRLSRFWDNDFAYGRSFIATTVTETGILGLIAWIFVSLAFLAIGVRLMRDKKELTFDRVACIISYVVALYLWFFEMQYVPGIVLFALTILFTAITWALLVKEGYVRVRGYSFEVQPSWAKYTAAGVLIVVTLALMYVVAIKTIASAYFNEANTLAGAGTIEAAETSLRSAIGFDARASYYRSLASLEAARIVSLATAFDQNQGMSTTTKQDIIFGQIEPLIASSTSDIATAIRLDPTDHRNWLMKGDIFTELFSMNYPNAYQNAYDAYTAALAHDPQSPLVYLSLARLKAVAGDAPGAFGYIRQALASKPDYTAALVLEEDIDISIHDYGDALAVAQTMVAQTPNDPSASFALGYALYLNGRCADAIAPLEKAIALAPSYTIAHYFLSVCDTKTGAQNDAIQELLSAYQSMPSSSRIVSDLQVLKAGKDPFQGVLSLAVLSQPSSTVSTSSSSAPASSSVSNTSAKTTTKAPVTHKKKR
jgi:tetratricopeptide (TPR) repeat protein